GAAVFVFMRDTLSSWTENWLVYFGVIFVAFVMFSPNGIVGVWARLRGLARSWRHRRSSARSARATHPGGSLPVGSASPGSEGAPKGGARRSEAPSDGQPRPTPRGEVLL